MTSNKKTTIKKIKLPLLSYLGNLSNEFLNLGIITKTQRNEISKHLLSKNFDDDWTVQYNKSIKR